MKNTYVPSQKSRRRHRSCLSLDDMSAQSLQAQPNRNRNEANTRIELAMPFFSPTSSRSRLFNWESEEHEKEDEEETRHRHELQLEWWKGLNFYQQSNMDEVTNSLLSLYTYHLKGENGVSNEAVDILMTQPHWYPTANFWKTHWSTLSHQAQIWICFALTRPTTEKTKPTSIALSNLLEMPVFNDEYTVVYLRGHVQEVWSSSHHQLLSLFRYVYNRDGIRSFRYLLNHLLYHNRNDVNMITSRLRTVKDILTEFTHERSTAQQDMFFFVTTLQARFETTSPLEDV